MTKAQKKKVMHVFVALFLIATIAGFAYYGATNFKVAKAKFSVDISDSSKIQAELKEELEDASSKSIVDIVTGSDPKEVTIIIESDDIESVPADVKFEEIDVGIATVTAEEAVELAKNPRVTYLYKDEKAEVFSSMSTSLRYLQTTPTSSSAGSGSKVCILDTGINANHAWFTGKTIHEMNFMYGAMEPGAEDDHGHGTHVAGIVTSVAPGADLYIAKVCSADGWCLFSDIMRAIDWCAEQDVDVVSMSLGTIRYSLGCDDYAITKQINRLTQSDGILFTMSAGNVDCSNCDDFKVSVPGCAAEGIAVSALDINNDDATSITNPASYDMTNLRTVCDGDGNCHTHDPGIELIDIMANGKVDSAWYKSRRDTVSMRGTSMAAPHVAGAVAVLESIDPSKSPETIRQALYDGATDGYAGNGLLNTAASCQVLMGESPITCTGYYSTQTSIKGSSKDWMKIKVDGQEQTWRRAGYRSVRERAQGESKNPDPIDYYESKSTYKYYEVRQIYDNVFYLRKTYSSGRIREEIHVWEYDADNMDPNERYKRAYVTRYYIIEPEKLSRYTRRLKASSELVFKPLEACGESQTSACNNYIREATAYSGSYKDIKYEDTILIKDPYVRKSRTRNNVGKGVVSIGGSINIVGWENK